MKKYPLYILLLVLFAPAYASTAKLFEPIVIIIENDRDTTIYNKGNKALTIETLFADLTKSFLPEDNDRPVIIITDPDTSIGTITNLRGLLKKIGYRNIRYFFYGVGKRMMAEISFDKPAIPFTTDPNAFK